ncbi:MAG TPA: helicase-related protein [Mucilaginibacter sp.]|nr:helicase-related protein [Mucilaginibacter sp.]
MYNQLQKLKDNIAAIRIALEWEKGTPVSADDRILLQRYAGFGGIKAILYPFTGKEEWIKLGASEADLRLFSGITELHELLQASLTDADYKTAISALKNSVLTAFYTPSVVPEILFRTLQENDIDPRYLYEPSAGAGVFVTEAVKAFPELQQINAVEKDILTGKVLAALSSSLSVPALIQVKGLEQTPATESAMSDLVVSNIPFGNFLVYDDAIKDKSLTGKIHNYFFAKGLDKIADGGLLAYITTNAFLNNPSNRPAREYLFSHADFVAVAVMPDNLMTDTGNTQAPNHLLIVQKNEGKQELSANEILLINTIEQQNEYGDFFANEYLVNHPETIIGDETRAGKNQYGQAHQMVWQHEPMEQIGAPLAALLSGSFATNIHKERFLNAQLTIGLELAGRNKQFTFQSVPENKPDTGQIQLGLFDMAPAQQLNRALAYLGEKDEQIISKQTARIISRLSTTQNPAHESIVLIAAQSGNKYLYKLYSNVAEIKPSNNWMTGAMLQNDLDNLSADLKRYGYQYLYEGDQTLEAKFGLQQNISLEFNQLKSYHQEGMLVLHQGKIGRITTIDSEHKNAHMELLTALDNRIPFYSHYIALRDSYLALTSEGVENEIRRKELRDHYDQFVQQYGLLNHPVNKRQLTEDKAFGMTLIASLERRSDGSYVRSDILGESLTKSEEHFKSDDPVEALARCLNDKGKVDIGFIEAATGLAAADVISALAHRIYLNPENREWETVDRYLSGNVALKLQMAQKEHEVYPDDIEIRKSLEAIQQVQPEKIPFELLDFNLGERWIPEDYYHRFATDLFELDTAVHYFPSLDTFRVTTKGSNAKTTQEYAVTPKSNRTTYGHALLEHALENTAPFFTYEVDRGDKTIRLPDNEAIQLAHQKIESIRNGFTEWLNNLPPGDKQYLTDLYNDTFNCYVLREYDGSHLTFPGLDLERLGIDDLYSSQKNAAWRIIQNRGALIDHEVGLGKTLTMIIAGQEMKRLGIINKPMIVALKANINQIRDTYKLAYPHARILAPDDSDYEPDKRLRLFHEIKNNNWDCVLLTHDQFGKIPQSVEIQQAIFENELDNVDRDLDTLKSLGGEVSRRMLKGLEIRKNNLEGKLKGLRADIEEKKDKGIDFKQLGIDHLFVDESHKFKNLTFTTRHDRVAGIGNMEGSQRALNMLFAVRTLQDHFNADLCVTFLSGTPISNSLTEMYLIFKYLRPKEMERQRIENFDAWAAVYARKTTDFEFSVTNEIIAKERFRHFIKVPELALFYNEITDYKIAEHIRLDKPVIEEILVNIKPTPDQQEFMKKLMDFAKTGNASAIGRPKLTEREDKARMLIATNYAKKMAADMRLISPLYADHPDSKLSTCARNLAREYVAGNEHKGTQIVFCDIGTPKSGQFDLYNALKEKLVRDFQIPAHEVSFIHDTEWSSPKLRNKTFRKMNEGQIRILIGSTEKAGTGLNVQKRIVALHHIDIPWKPSELEQRNGRGARQGNWLAKMFCDNKVRTYIYAVEQSLDNYKFNLLKNKQTFISQMKNCELNVRTIDEGALDEKSGMNFSEYIAILSGDTSLLEKTKMEKKVAVIESLKRAYFKELSGAKFELAQLLQSKQESTGILAKLDQDEQFYKSQLQFNKDGTKSNPIHFHNLNSTDPEIIGKHLINIYLNWQTGADPKLGSLYGFDLYVQQHHESEFIDGKNVQRHFNTFYAERPKTGIKYTFNQGHPNIDNPKLAARHFLNAIDRVSTLREKYAEKIRALEKEIPLLQQIIAKPFEKEKELAEMKTSLANLEREIALRITEKQLKESGQLELDQPKENTTVEPVAAIRIAPGVQERPTLRSAYIMPPNVQRRRKGLSM